jgi:inosine-uridine nucleoside N-ribohydrolase
VRVVRGASHALLSRDEGRPSTAVEEIVAEAMRDDAELPLFVACGGGLTNIASAWLAEPRIGAHLTLVWIGGAEHEGLAEPQPGPWMEYNTSIDRIAAQVIFNDSDMRIWQVPRDAYQQVLVSRSELVARMQPHGELGAYLFNDSQLVGPGDGILRRALGRDLRAGGQPVGPADCAPVELQRRAHFVRVAGTAASSPPGDR